MFSASLEPLPLGSSPALCNHPAHSACQRNLRPPLESPAHCKAERALRLKQSRRDRLRRLQLLEERLQTPEQPAYCKRQTLQSIFDRRIEITRPRRRRNRAGQPQVIVRVIEAERRIDDRQEHHKLGARRSVRPEIRAGQESAGCSTSSNSENPDSDIAAATRHAAGIQSQLRLPQHPVDAEIVEQGRTSRARRSECGIPGSARPASRRRAGWECIPARSREASARSGMP